MNSRGFQVAAIVMMVLCFVSAVLQYNDPDPIQWAAYYLAGTVISGWAAFRPASLKWPLPALVAVIGAIWAYVIATHLHGTFAFAHLAETMHAETPVIEESRETLGLLIVALWMAIVAFRHRRPRPLSR